MAKKKQQVEEQDARVFEMRARGLSFREISLVFKDSSGRHVYKTVAAAHKAYTRELARRQELDVNYRQVNIRRLDIMISDLWGKREDPKVASVIDKLIRTQSVITGDARGVGTIPDPGIPTVDGSGRRGLPQSTYANWATADDIADAADILDADYEEISEEE